MNSHNIYIILSHPFTADNIGSAARAMKNMGFSNLRIVSPRRNWRKRAYVLARSAAEIITHAETYPTLKDAVGDLNWTYGTTRRIRSKSAKFIPFESFISFASKKSANTKVGIIFGRETKGLTSEELDFCDQLLSLPADEAYPSLNLAQAVMVTLFSLARQQLTESTDTGFVRETKMNFVDKEGVQSALQSFSEALECLGFYGGKDGRLDKIIKITDAIFKRAGMFDYEARMLKGISARICERLPRNK